MSEIIRQKALDSIESSIPSGLDAVCMRTTLDTRVALERAVTHEEVESYEYDSLIEDTATTKKEDYVPLGLLASARVQGIENTVQYQYGYEEEQGIFSLLLPQKNMAIPMIQFEKEVNQNDCMIARVLPQPLSLAHIQEDPRMGTVLATERDERSPFSWAGYNDHKQIQTNRDALDMIFKLARGACTTDQCSTVLQPEAIIEGLYRRKIIANQWEYEYSATSALLESMPPKLGRIGAFVQALSMSDDSGLIASRLEPDADGRSSMDLLYSLYGSSVAPELTRFRLESTHPNQQWLERVERDRTFGSFLVSTAGIKPELISDEGDTPEDTEDLFDFAFDLANEAHNLKYFMSIEQGRQFPEFETLMTTDLVDFKLKVAMLHDERSKALSRFNENDSMRDKDYAVEVFKNMLGIHCASIEDGLTAYGAVFDKYMKLMLQDKDRYVSGSHRIMQYFNDAFRSVYGLGDNVFVDLGYIKLPASCTQDLLVGMSNVSAVVDAPGCAVKLSRSNSHVIVESCRDVSVDSHSRLTMPSAVMLAEHIQQAQHLLYCGVVVGAVDGAVDQPKWRLKSYSNFISAQGKHLKQRGLTAPLFVDHSNKKVSVPVRRITSLKKHKLKAPTAKSLPSWQATLAQEL